ncbi:winged helix-turn-helix domain-containing protein [Ferrimonas aestuarii]|uniref:Response regulator n=1 Tax=Ferrimonas aestuarii TaxID=2569539 RepID=A0A4V5NZL5_9GAMM|nr:winged helix-turn-helix domain-containing protein [Ferrimonas aestuarii]TKB56544.1 response regulator [Ferrimonas aestuarii]
MLYCFEQFELDTERHSLRCDQDLLQCDERSIRLLILLAESAPEPVSQQQLLDQLWPDTVVSNWSVSRLISDTRKLLAKQGVEFQVIQTVHGRGYRLASEAQERLRKYQSGKTTPTSSSQDSETKLPQSGLMFTMLLATSMVALLFLAIWQLNESIAPEELPNPLARILWVDDHPENNLNETKFLNSQQVAIFTVTSTEEALQLLTIYRYDVVISDMGRNGDWLAGLKLVKALREKGDRTPFLIYTFKPSEAQIKMVHEQGAQGVTGDPFSLYQMLAEHIPLPKQIEL